MKISLGMPTNREIKIQTALSLMKMVASSEHDFVIDISTKGYNCAENRNYIVSQAVKNESDYLLFIDDDMIFEPEHVEALIAHDKDIVGATYNTKYEEQKLVIEYLDDKRPEELFKCKALGGGLLLIKTDVFKKISQPHFGYKWFDNGMVKMSNDWFFCEKAIEAGYDIWCDPTLKVLHIGYKVY